MFHLAGSRAPLLRALVLGLAIVIVGATIRAARADDPTPLPVITISGLATTYLSTKHVDATISVMNPTAQTLHFYPYFTSLDGSEAALGVNVISRPPERKTVAPGATASFTKSFPTCVVVLDSCIQKVTAAIRFQELHDLVRSAEYRYTIVPDPSSTFRIEGFPSNRPVILAEVTGSEPLGFTKPALALFAPWDPVTVNAPPALAAAATVIAKHGIAQAQSGSASPTGITQNYDLIAGADPVAIADTIRDVRQQFGGKLTISVVFRNESFQPGAMVLDDGNIAEAAATYVGVNPLVESPSLDRMEYSINAEPASSPSAAYVGYHELGTFAFERLPRPDLFTVFGRGTMAYVGVSSTAAIVPVAQPNDERYDELESMRAPLTRLVIADDRTQVFAAGFANVGTAAARGIDPQAASIDIAMRRCKELAADLGLETGPLTLAVLYPRSGTVAASGVAMATTGTIPLPALRPTPPPTSTPVTSGPVPMAVYSPATFPPSVNSPQTPPPEPEPVDVYDPGDTLIYKGSASVEVPADELLLTIDIEADGSLSQELKSSVALEDLRADPRVAAAAITARSAGSYALFERYHVVMRNANAASARNVVNVARVASGSRSVKITSAYTGALRSCRLVGVAAVRAAAHDALVGAANAATMLRLNVHRLIFAKVDGPAIDAGRCAPDARSDGFPDPARDGPTLVGEPLTVTVRAGVRLTFRAFRFGT